jgi:hypothetical protein
MQFISEKNVPEKTAEDERGIDREPVLIFQEHGGFPLGLTGGDKTGQLGL